MKSGANMLRRVADEIWTADGPIVSITGFNLTAARPTVPQKFQMTFHDRAVARTASRRILTWLTEAVLTAHGSPIAHDGRSTIAHAFKWLLRE
jgi:hypothetical protein